MPPEALKMQNMGFLGLRNHPSEGLKNRLKQKDKTNLNSPLDLLKNVFLDPKTPSTINTTLALT